MINKAILMGRLCADPELKQTPSGVSVCTFRVAVNRRYTGKEGKQEADFITVVAWRKTAEFVDKYFTKGSMIIVEGSIQTRSYEDKQGGRRTAVEVVADNIQFGESKRQSDTQEPQNADFTVIDIDSQDLPF